MTQSGGADSPPATYPPRRSVVAWIFFDWSAQPFFTLVTTFVFAPFFASALASDAAEGQALWGYATGLAGLAIALLSPLLGGIADRTGPRKPWIAVFGAMLVAGSAMLWYAKPGSPWAVPIALAGFVIGTIGAEFATIFNNAMMTRLVPPERLGRLSGTGWAVGYLGGLVSLTLTLGFLAADPHTGKTLAGLSPLFGLDAAAREGDRFSGPLTALWFVIFVTPMFLLTPDSPRTGIPLKAAAAGGFSHLKATIAELPSLPGLGRFLLANMIYQDGLVALFAFGGIYGAGVFGWQTIELGVFGILLTVTGTLGAWAGGKLDDAIGGKPVILGAIACLLFACIGILSLGPGQVAFVIEAAPATPGDGLFASLPEKVYLGLGLLIGLVAGPLQASSRSLLARIAPPARIGEFFGLFALAGKVTSFLGPTLVALATTVFASQRAGLAVLIGFFLTGAWLIAGVKVKRP
ncbi:MFS transporter, UMF1 family [Bosea sp. 62]|uniref:MFS transporter n=1 Tax=unclassified Bosea (in: a-proteobacteria) TaxID=2653178 RepID=UPI0012550DF7|nr:MULTISPECIES: MFS transporter [unclassified Bosea (in: a-proteobacteria)]CAD5260581.1 MFS transporter, UMF1 family [Bosea sp. 7B]CAD5271929.1 MFS transporter, UMF1 family [Bosea sp. 21B]CAD5274134.1 MFS transporter, UMF1 family [Bosea sp. 46]VVT56283.1 MFS transporter, UMF1 family [Bosea sp. EC-HK365B]VXB62185.1 MFS transporter, UMF1 family [Bosea sp. 62]